MLPLLRFVDYLLDLYKWVVIASVVFSWLIAFNVINVHNPFVRSVWRGLNAFVEPVLKPIRRILPDLGGLDISPIVLFIILQFIQGVVIWGWLAPMLATR